MSSLLSSPIFRTSFGLFLVTLLLRLFGYGEKIILAYYFGTTGSADAFILVSTIIMSFFFFAREVVEPALLNVFTKCEVLGNHQRGRNVFNYTLRITFVLSAIAVVAGGFYKEEVIEFCAPGFDMRHRLESESLFLIALPAVIFLSLSAVTNIILNSRKVFVAPAMGDVIFKLITIATVVAFASKFGIRSAAIGLVIGASIKLTLHLCLLSRQVSIKAAHVELDDKKRMWSIMWPLIIGMFFSQLSGLVDNLFASHFEEGAIASLSYSKKIVELPVTIFPYVLSVVLFPYLTQNNLERNYQKSLSLLLQTIRWVIISFIPIAIYFLFFSRQIVEVILERGAFDEKSSLQTSQPLMIYSFGLLFFAIETLIVVFYYANANTKTPIIVGIVCVVINIIITYAAIPHIGYLAIAAAFVIQKSLKVVLLVFLLIRKQQVRSSSILRFILRISLPTVIFAITLYTLKGLFKAGDETGILIKLTYLSFIFIVGLLVYIIVSTIVGLIKVPTAVKVAIRP